jgi:hypothetical protein
MLWGMRTPTECFVCPSVIVKPRQWRGPGALGPGAPGGGGECTRVKRCFLISYRVLLLTDEKGIIMGEFGFITADGIYHVTVYATDENGDFKILKMKNIKVGFRELYLLRGPQWLSWYGDSPWGLTARGSNPPWGQMNQHPCKLTLEAVQPLYNRCQGEAAGTLTIHPHLTPRFTLGRAIPLLPPPPVVPSMASCGEALYCMVQPHT